MATLEVGNQDIGVRIFHVRESLICQIDFFRAALRGGFKEASTKRITMPEDDPLHMACLLEFLCTGSYRVPHFSEEVGDLADDRRAWMRGLYHGGVMVLAEKYGFRSICWQAAAGVNVYFRNLEDRLEYLVQLYEISGPGSSVRIIRSRSSASLPRVWDPELQAEWIGSMWRCPMKRQLVEEASTRCPDFGEDIQVMKAWRAFGRSG